MKIQCRYRTVGLAALAISLLAIGAFPQTAWASDNAQANSARNEVAAEKRAAARGQQVKHADGEAASSPVANNVDGSAGPTTHSGGAGPGDQTCDGDPDNPDGAGGLYDNTCDGYPDPNPQGSDNGAGDGQATGKPCEGCVGNADDKDPAGQAGGGPVDANNGYECDQRGRSGGEGNNGIGFGNPAHTSCAPPTGPECVPTATQNPDCTEKCVPTATQDASCKEKCVPTATQDASCKEKTCPEGQQRGADGTCSRPCVADVDAECSLVTPTCVASFGSERCGGTASAQVLGVQLERLEVAGVTVDAPAASVAPAALARTGGFEITALFHGGLVLALLGLALSVVGRRRFETVDIASRLAGW